MEQNTKEPSKKRINNTVPDKGANYLLAIAINEYQHCSKLSNSVRDVEAFTELLITRYDFESEHVIFIKDSQATKKGIENTFHYLIDIIGQQDNLIIYFSGHGSYDERRGGYWVPVEAGQNNEWSDYLSNVLIKDYLGKIKSFHTFLIADSCFSGSLFIDKSNGKPSSERRDTKPSRWGLTSGKKEIVSDGHPGHHSPFAAALLEALRKADKPLSVISLCDQIMEVVTANEHQTPMYSPLKVKGHQYGQFVFYFKEDKDWLDWQNTLEGCETYLEKYPNGKYVTFAKNRLDANRKEDLGVWESKVHSSATTILSQKSNEEEIEYKDINSENVSELSPPKKRGFKFNFNSSSSVFDEVPQAPGITQSMKIRCLSFLLYLLLIYFGFNQLHTACSRKEKDPLSKAKTAVNKKLSDLFDTSMQFVSGGTFKMGCDIKSMFKFHLA